MRFALLCKRYYTNRDLFRDRFGRLYHLPVQLTRLGHSGVVVAADYRGRRSDGFDEPELTFRSIPFSLARSAHFVAASYQAIKQARPDVIIASGDIHFGALGLFYARRLGVPFVFDVYDDYGVFASAKIPAMRMLFRRTLRRADMLVTASAPLADYLADLNRRITVIENGVDSRLFRPIAQDQARAELGIPLADTVIGFFGSIERNRGAETLVEAARLVGQTRPATRLLLAGTNAIGLNLSQPGIDYRGVVAQSEVPRLINACDVAVIPYHGHQLENMANACKIAEYLACDVPVVTTRVSNFAEIFAATPQAICEPADPRGMANAILAQLNAPQRLPFVENDYSWTSLGRRLERNLSGLLADKI